ncbi:hypothetical protein S4A8_10906 [Salinisphaera sp. S4-8]
MDEAMKKSNGFRPRFIFVLALAAAGGLAGGTWWYAQSPQFNGLETSTETAPLANATPTGKASADETQALAELPLAVDGATQLVEHTKTQRSDNAPAHAHDTHGVDADTAGTFVENDAPAKALDLNVPASPADDSEQLNAAKVAANTHEVNPLDVSEFEQHAPKVESYNLFKSEYGLRGFMKQNWLNQRVALQGGLGLNDDRLIKTDSDFRDDIAVGMGLIVAF